MMYETYDNEILNEFRGISHPRLGVVGGGQLAKMTALAALQLGCEVIVLERNNYSPAAQLATQSLVGNWDDPEALIKLASKTDVVSIENEFLDPDALEIIEKSGRPLYPSTATLRRIQDKLIQKQTLSEVGLETPQYAKVNGVQDIVTFAEATGWPVVMKTRRYGYDGKGNFTVSGAAEVSAAWSVLDGNQRALYVEEFCEFTSELATIITRGIDGSVVQYPVVETVQSNHICHLVRAPAQVSGEIAKKAAHLALKAISHSQIVL
ncbi:MAG: ATP-grasp domain-containing protein [Chromatiaceae bacterium]